MVSKKNFLISLLLTVFVQCTKVSDKSDEPPQSDDPLRAAAGTFATQEDTALEGKIEFNGTGRETLSVVTPPNRGVVTELRGDGFFRYTPHVNENGDDAFEYEISRPGSSTKGVVTISISPINDPPQVSGVTYSVGENRSSIEPIRVIDVDNAIHSFSIESQGKWGVATLLDSSSGQVSYVPTAETSGTDEFTVLITDEGGTSTRATITIDIKPEAILNDGLLIPIP